MTPKKPRPLAWHMYRSTTTGKTFFWHPDDQPPKNATRIDPKPTEEK